MADKLKEQIQDHLLSQIVNGEYEVSKRNQQMFISDFESYVDAFDAIRAPKTYDWQSDISIPEFASHMLTQCSVDSQFFSTRDFTEVYLEDDSDRAKANSEAAKELINRTLNQKHLYHYQKFIRARLINNLAGSVYIKCWWEQEVERGVVGHKKRLEPLDVDVYGNPIVDETQEPAYREVVEPIIGDIPVIDRFNYEVYDPRNVFTDNSYVYSIQDKKWVIFRDEVTYSELKQEAEQNGYFNLDKLKDIKPADETETSRESYNKDQEFQAVTSSIEKPFDRLERYGKFWTIVDKDDDGNPIPGTERPGIDLNGQPLPEAELHEVIITIILSKGAKVLIGYKLTPYIDAEGNPYRPIIRGICYIHPTFDGGAGDGKYTRELQLAIDDTFNISQDRVMLATLPTLKGRKYSIEDNSSVYFEPMHLIEVEETSDVEEFKISDNINGALAQIAMLQAKMQQVDSIQPPTMGQTPSYASTTATAVAAAARGQTTRSNYKSLTFEYTVLTELYWMIQQMTYQFAKPETGFKLMGDKVYDFDPTRNYYYKLVSQTIETEESKMMKRKEWTTILGYVAQIQHPDAVKIINYILTEIIKLMGDEYANFAEKKLAEHVPIQQGQIPQAQPGLPESAPPSNQSGIPMSAGEQATRQLTYGM